MKSIIEQSGKTLKEFAEFYEIPYNTVRQWYNGERNTPSWVKKLIEKAAKGTQLDMFDTIYYFKVFDKETGKTLREYMCDSEYQREKMIEINTGVTKNTIIIKKDLIQIN